MIQTALPKGTGIERLRSPSGFLAAMNKYSDYGCYCLPTQVNFLKKRSFRPYQQNNIFF